MSTKKRTNKNYRIIAVISMSHSPISTKSQNLAPILQRSVWVHGQSFSVIFTKYSKCVTLILTSVCWNNRDGRRSGYLQVSCKAFSTGAPSFLESAPPQSLAALPTFRYKSSLYSCFFCFQVGVFHQRFLINIYKLISLSVALYYSNSESLCLLPEEVLVASIQHLVWLLQKSFASLPLVTSLSILFFFFCSGRPIFPHVVHTS